VELTLRPPLTRGSPEGYDANSGVSAPVRALREKEPSRVMHPKYLSINHLTTPPPRRAGAVNSTSPSNLSEEVASVHLF
jgi:hypothetical protein